MRNHILILLLLFSISQAIWYDDDAEARVCLNINMSGTATKYDGTSLNTVFLIDVDHEPGFDSPYAGYMTDGTPFDVFRYADNTTQDFFVIPAMHNTTNSTYCIYSGGSDNEDLSGIARYYTEGDDAGNFIGSCTSSGGVCAVTTSLNSSSFSASQDREVLVKMNNTGKVSFYNGATERLRFLRNETAFYYWYGSYYQLYPSVDYASMFIVKMNSTNTTIYDSDNLELNTSTHPMGYSTTFLNINSPIGVDWALYYRPKVITELSETYETQQTNITIDTPLFNSTYSTGDFTNIRFSVYTGYDNCSVYLNGDLQGDVDTPGVNENVIVNSSSVIPGENLINVTCLLSSIPEYRYGIVNILDTQATDLFLYAFDEDISGCPTETLNALAASCERWFRTEDVYDFSAIPCYNLESVNISCLDSFSDNVTKNGWTFFVTPGWGTHNQTTSAIDMQHIGAEFYYNNIAITNGFEIFDNNSFVYMPAQYQIRDCGIYYTTPGANCALWSGFILNDRPVYVSNENNEWFAASGYGVTLFNANYTQTTVAIATTPIKQFLASQDQLANMGIFTRIHCSKEGNEWIMQTVNTLPTSYELDVGGYNAFDYQVTSSTFDYIVPIYNDTTVNLTSNGRQLCYYGVSDLMLLPFSIPSINTDFTGIFIKMMFVFSVVVSALIPYSLVITVVFNDMFHLFSAQYLAMIIVFACISSLVNAAYQSSKGIKNMILMLGLLCGFILALGSSMDNAGLPDSSPLTSLFTSFKNITEAQTITDMVAGLFTFAIQLFVTVMLLPVVLVNYIFDLISFINPNIGAAVAPFQILAIAGVVYLYIKAYEVLGNKFRDV